MLLYYDITKPLYVIGNSVMTEEIVNMVKHSSPLGQVQMVDHEHAAALPQGSQCMLGFADIQYRQNWIQHGINAQWRWPSFIDPGATIDDTATIGPGCVIYANAMVGYEVTLDGYALIGPFCYLSHGCTFGHNVVAPMNVFLGGSSSIGNNVWFGQCSSVRDKIKIADNAWFIMNSIVTKDITKPGKYLGSKKVPVS